MKLVRTSLLLLTLCFLLPSWALETKLYTGIAKLSDGKVAYVEHHTAQFDENGRIVSAKTEYKSEDGKIIGTLASDFTKNITAPSYRYVDERTGNEHGIRFENDTYTLFNKPKEKSEEVKNLKKDFAKKAIVVGCQGLHYYLRENLENVKAQKKVPLKFLIPGDLDYYSFEMKYVTEDENGLVTLKINIQNMLLRVFAPDLTVKYDKKTGHLLTYEGLSNIPNEKGKLQKVEITYNYDDTIKKN